MWYCFPIIGSGIWTISTDFMYIRAWSFRREQWEDRCVTSGQCKPALYNCSTAAIYYLFTIYYLSKLEFLRKSRDNSSFKPWGILWYRFKMTVN